MMLKNKSKAVIVFLISLFIAISLTGCSDAGNTDDTDAENEERITYTVDESYTYIRAEEIDKSAQESAATLCRAIRDNCGVNLSFISDWTIENKANNTVESSSDVHEILIGNTNRAETRETREMYKHISHGYVIRAVNGKIVIWGTDTETLIYAIDYVRNNCISDSKIEFEEGIVRVWDINAEGSPLDTIKKEYSIVYSSKDDLKIKDAAEYIIGELNSLCGSDFKAKKDTEKEDKCEILIGNTNRKESLEVKKELDYLDYTVRAVNGKIVILGGNPLATLTAAEKFASIITTERFTLEDGLILESDYDRLLEGSLMYTADSFVPVWADKFTPPEWMLDYEEKLYTLTTPAGRISSDAHRGDIQNYPENSMEGILSAVMLGADVVEIDINLSKDNVMVLMHDDSLKRTTDWKKKKGTNGLPTSDKISDWTFEQLRELRLLYNGEVTDCVIPSMYEVAGFFKKRAQIHFDSKNDNIDPDTDVFLLAEATGTKESFIYYYGLDTMLTWVNNDPSDTEFKEFYDKMSALLADSRLRRRNTSVSDNYADAPSGWKQCYADGYPKMLTDFIYNFCKFSAKEQEPNKYN